MSADLAIATPAERICDEAVVTAAMVHGISTNDILGRSTRSDIVRARWHAMRRAYDAGLNQSEIARYFGRDASSIHYAVRGAAPTVMFKTTRRKSS